MKIVARHSQLVRCLKALRSLSPVNNSILCSADKSGKTLRLTAVDNQYIAFASLDLDLVSSSGEMTMLLPFDKLLDLVSKGNSDDVVFEYNNAKFTAKIAIGDKRATIKGFDPSVYHLISGKFDAVENMQGCQVSVDVIYNTIGKVAHAVGDSAPVLTGVCLEISQGRMTAVCLDGYRMAVVFDQELSGSPRDATLVVPASQIKLLMAILNQIVPTHPSGAVRVVEMFYNDDVLVFKSDGLKAGVVLVDGKYPDFRRAIPTEFAVKGGCFAVVDTRVLLSAIEWSLVVNNVQLQLDFLAKSRQLIISAFDQETGDSQETLNPVEFAGFDASLIVHANHLVTQVKIMNNFGYERLTLLVDGDSRPLVVHPYFEGAQETEYLALHMPISGQTHHQTTKRSGGLKT